MNATLARGRTTPVVCHSLWSLPHMGLSPSLMCSHIANRSISPPTPPQEDSALPSSVSRLSPSGTKWLWLLLILFPPLSAIICSPGWQLLAFIPSIARLLGLNDMLFQRSCSNDIITPAQPPSHQQHSGMDYPLSADLLQNTSPTRQAEF